MAPMGRWRISLIFMNSFVDATCGIDYIKIPGAIYVQTVYNVCYFSGKCRKNNSDKFSTSKYTFLGVCFKYAYCLHSFKNKYENNVIETLLNNFVKKQYPYSYMLWWLLTISSWNNGMGCVLLCFFNEIPRILFIITQVIYWCLKFSFLRLHVMFLSMNCLFEKQNKTKTDRPRYHMPPLYKVYLTRDSQQDDFRLSNWFCLRCLGRGWTTCLLCGGPHLDLCF